MPPRRRFLAILLACLIPALPGCRPRGDRPIVVGSKNFTEQAVLAEILAQEIEERGRLLVERRVNLGGTLICHQALRAGEIDLYVEYTGTALTAILGEPPSRDPAEVRDRVRAGYARLSLEWMGPLGFNNTFALVVRGEDARRLGLKSVSDTVPHAPRWRAGFGYEFMERPDGFQGLAETYGLRFGRPPRTMELGLIYRALKEGQVDIVAGNSTDGLIGALDLVALEDDRRYFPPYEAASVVRRETLSSHPRLGAILESLAGALTEEEMRRLNYAVDGLGRDVKQVVEEFRRAGGITAAGPTPAEVK
jgi:glycine betaine/choline ABC-type transport system substrate-binding protein